MCSSDLPATPSPPPAPPLPPRVPLLAATDVEIASRPSVSPSDMPPGPSGSSSCTVRLMVTEKGKVESDVPLCEGSDGPAMAKIGARYRFRPHKVDGKAVAFAVDLTIQFVRP